MTSIAEQCADRLAGRRLAVQVIFGKQFSGRRAKGMFCRITELWQHLVYATTCSLAGLRSAFQHERSFREELGVLLFVIPAGLWLGDGGVERALLIGSWILVLVVELVNSALETVVDRVGLETNELSRRAKDLGSAAVFSAMVLAGVVWLLVLTGHASGF